MELVLILFCLWVLGCINGGLIWYIQQQQENMYWERQDMRDLIQKVTENAQAERKDLYDRLMAGTLTQYKEQSDPVPNEVEDTPEETVPLDEAREEIMNG